MRELCLDKNPICTTFPDANAYKRSSSPDVLVHLFIIDANRWFQRCTSKFAVDIVVYPIPFLFLTTLNLYYIYLQFDWVLLFIFSYYRLLRHQWILLYSAIHKVFPKVTLLVSASYIWLLTVCNVCYIFQDGISISREAEFAIEEENEPEPQSLPPPKVYN